MWDGDTWYPRGAIISGLAHFLFQRLEMLKPHVLDRYFWGYYLESQFR